MKDVSLGTWDPIALSVMLKFSFPSLSFSVAVVMHGGVLVQIAH